MSIAVLLETERERENNANGQNNNIIQRQNSNNPINQIKML